MKSHSFQGTLNFMRLGRYYSTTQMQRRLTRVQVIKNSLIKGDGTHFIHEYLSCFVWDECSQTKWVPHPLISELLNRSHFCKTALHLSGTIHFIKQLDKSNQLSLKCMSIKACNHVYGSHLPFQIDQLIFPNYLIPDLHI